MSPGIKGKHCVGWEVVGERKSVCWSLFFVIAKERMDKAEWSSLVLDSLNNFSRSK